MSRTNDELIALLRSPARLRTLSDAELMAALCAGCNDALAVLFDRHSALVLQVARGSLCNDGEAEDTVQRAFPSVFRAEGQFNSDRSETTPTRRHELLIEILKFLTPCLALVSSLVALTGKYSWLSKPWLFHAAGVLGVLTILLWFGKPRLEVRLQRIRGEKRDQRFIAANHTRLQELWEELTVFTSSGNTRSLLCILSSLQSPKMQAVKQIMGGDWIGSWLHCYNEQLTVPAATLHHLLSRCKEFSHIVQEFNTNYVLRTQRQLANGTPLAEHSIAQLEEFREEYNAFLRGVERWAKGVSNYLRSRGVAEHSSLWRLAPVNYFERAQSFRCRSRNSQKGTSGV